MVFVTRRYFRRTLGLKSLVNRLLIPLTIVIIFTVLSVIFDKGSQTVTSDFLHPISVLWRKRKLNHLIRPELDTAIIQPSLEYEILCNQNRRHTSISDDNQLRILIMVMSAPQNWKARKAIRETWASNASLLHDARIFFMLGISAQKEVTKMVEEESNMYNDIIMEDFLDSYDNLTLKTLFTLKWASNWCSAATHLLKTDDDMLIRVDNLKKRIIHTKNTYFKLESKYETHFQKPKDNKYINTELNDDEEDLNKEIEPEDFKEEEIDENYLFVDMNHLTKNQSIDYLSGNTSDKSYIETRDLNTQDEEDHKTKSHMHNAYILGMIYHGQTPMRDGNSKWFLPRSLYPYEYLPDFAAGVAYAIANGNGPQGAIKAILLKSMEVKPALPLEDVFITGEVAGNALKLPLIQDNTRFHKAIPFIFPWSISRLASCYYQESVAIHGLSPEDIILGWKSLEQITLEDCNTILGFLQKTLYRFLSIFEMHIDKS